MNNYEFLVLKKLTEILEVDKKQSLSFSGLSYELEISKYDLDNALNTLEMKRFIDQFVSGSSDHFLVILKQKGLDESRHL